MRITKHKNKKLLSGDALFVFIVILSSLALLAAILFFDKQNQPETENAPQTTAIETQNQVTVGNPEAQVEVVQFFDFQCPHCQAWDQQVYPDLASDYIDTGKIKYTLINFPFLGKQSEKAALMFETINGLVGAEQAFSFKQNVFKAAAASKEPSTAFYDKELLKAAEKAITAEQFKAVEASFKDKEYAAALEIDAQLVKDNGVMGTPSVFVNSKFIQDGSNPTSLFAAIDEALASTPTK